MVLLFIQGQHIISRTKKREKDNKIKRKNITLVNFSLDYTDNEIYCSKSRDGDVHNLEANRSANTPN